MEIAVHGRHVEVPAELRRTASDKIGHLGKYLEGMERAEVRFFEERNPRIAEPVGCEVIVMGHGHVVRASANGRDTLAALDRVTDKVAHRLTRLKSRLVGRSHPHHDHGPHNHWEPPSVNGEPEDDEGTPPARRNGGVGTAEIVRTKRFAVKPMSPEEAMLQLELQSDSFYFFANSETERPAVLYRRADGRFGLIDAP
ncbi:MAG TPA: ribosome-associated translation inhibitor RaiA [Acidimicrobiales bacterium]|nr:ribosome-associated translation inhibitor RaiA [Acidimicrobiales bacterium]